MKDRDRKINNSWRAMIARCYNKNNNRYVNYGARGIVVCADWKKFSNFREWAIENGYKEGLSIDRIDVNGNYEPSNCKWSTNTEQGNNRTNNRLETINGITHTMAEWVEIAGINKKTVYTRLRNGWDVERAIFYPLEKSKRNRRAKTHD